MHKYLLLIIGVCFSAIAYEAQAQCTTVQSTPFSEDFESNDWTKGSSQAAGDVDTCWQRTPIDEFFFKTGPNPFIFNATGASNDHTLGTSNGQYIYSVASGFTFNNDTAELISPAIDVSSLTNPWLTFWYHMYGSDITYLETFISIDNGLTFSSLDKLNGEQQNSTTDAWKEREIDLLAYANDTIRIKFQTVRRQFDFNVYSCIDDFEVKEKPTCPKPSNFQLNYVTQNEVSFSWNTGGASNWELEYGNVGFNPGNGTRVPAGSNPFTLTNLQANRKYDVYLRDSCGTGDVSDWVGPLSIQTLCAPVFFTPFNEDFDGNNFGPISFQDPDGKIGGCWRRENQSGNYIWTGSGGFSQFGTGPINDHTGGGDFAVIKSLNFSNQKDSSSLETPLIITTNLDTAQLSFWYHMYGNSIRKLEVYVRSIRSSYVLMQTITGQQQQSANDSWKESVITLNQFAGDTIQIKFSGYRNSQNTAEIAIDDVVVDSIPSCPRPSNFTATTLQTNSAKFSWTTGGATNWQLEYGNPGFTVGSGTRVSTSGNPFTVSGLSANTKYDFYLRDSCGANDLSDWVGPISITTPCAAVTAPWFEDFEGNSFVNRSFFNNGSIDNCFERDSSNRFIWVPTNTNQSFFTGASVDHTKGNTSGRYMSSVLGAFSVNNTTNTAFTTPPIDMSNLTVPQLTFWYHMYGNNIDSLQVQIDDNGFQRIFSIQGQQQTASTDSWRKAIVSLSSYANDTARLRFVSFRNGIFSQNVNVSIDDVNVRETPSCPEPDSLIVNNFTASTATLSWLSGGASNWQIEYGNAGFNPGTGTLVNASANPFTLTGLNANSRYDFYLRDSCGAGDVSLWVGPLKVRTACNPVTAPWVEDFEGNSFVNRTFFDDGSIDPCFNRDTTLNYIWAPTTTPPGFNTGPNGDHTSGNGTFMVATRSTQFPTTNTLSTQFLTPPIDLSPLTVPELTFYYHMFGNQIDSLKLEVLQGSWQSVLGLSGQQQTSSADAWKKAVVDLASYANDTIQLRFTAYQTSFTSFSNNVSIDDLDIHEAPSCPEPTNLSSTASSASSITLSWTSGGASNWQIEYGAPGFTPGSGTLINATSNPFTVNGLSASTAYEFYVRDSCGVGDVSLFSQSLTARTDCGPVTAPIKENFDQTPWKVANSFNDTGRINTCWSRSNVGAYYWLPGPHSVFTNNFTGPASDHTSGSGQFLYSFQRNFTANNDAILSTYPIDVSALTKPQLVFWYHMFGNKIASLEVEVNDGTGFTNEWTKSGQQQNSETDAWKEAIIDLSPYSGDTITIRFTGKMNSAFSTNAEIAIDDFWVRETPTCPAPSGLTVTSSTQSSITVDWTSGGATNWLVGYRTSSGGGSFTYQATSTKPYTISGLNPSTSYDIVVKDSCSANDVSFASQNLSASTQCGMITAPFAEYFDNNTAWNVLTDSIDKCWFRNPKGGNFPEFTFTWLPNSGPTPFFGSGPDKDASGSGQYIFTNSRGGNGVTEITSPKIRIPSSLQNPKLFFKYHMFGFNIDSLILRINDGNGWGTNNWSLAGQQQNSSSAPWIMDSLDLSGFIGDTIELRFRGVTSGFLRADMAVDEIEIKGDLLVCETPDTLSVTNITVSSADISLDTVGPNPTNLSYYEILAGPAASIVLQNVGNTLTLNNLQPSTTYVVSAYDSCGTSTLSGSISDTFTTLSCDTTVAAFSMSQSFLTVNVDGSATIKADTLSWDFGDGTVLTGSGTTANHSYASGGTYTITLTAFNDCGSLDTTTQVVTVCDPIADSSFNLTQVNDSISLRPNTLNTSLSYFWNFGDGTTSTNSLENHTYSSFGNYTVTLTIVTACGDSVSSSQNVNVCQPAVADWYFKILDPVGGLFTVEFDASGSQNANSYQWDFGDGNTGSGMITTHSYSTPGLFYEVTLTVKNGCSSDKLKYRLADRVSLDELNLGDNLSLFPNPTAGRLTLSWPSELLEVRSIRVSNLAGQSVLQRESPANDGNWSLSIEDLPKGVYQIKIETDRGAVVKRILKR